MAEEEATPSNQWTTDSRNWPYGRIWWNENGKPTYHIRVRIKGVRYQVSTRRSELEAAINEYRNFEKNPEGYRPSGGAEEQGPAPIHIDADLKKAFLKWSKNEGVGGEGNSTKYVRDQGYDLDWWGEQLLGLDLRAGGRKGQVTTEILEEKLKKADGTKVGCYPQRIRTISVLYTWLAKERRIATSENPVAGRITAPKAKKAVLTGTKRIIEAADYYKVVDQLYEEAAALPREVELIMAAARDMLNAYGPESFLAHGRGGILGEMIRRTGLDEKKWRTNLYYYFRDGADILDVAQTGQYQYRAKYQRPAPSKWGDILVFIGGGGFHVTEASRFCRGEGIILPIPPGTEHLGGAGSVVVDHKTQKPHPERVSERCLEAAKRLLGAGGFNHNDLNDAIKAACEKVGVEPFTAGILRHKFITNALENGATLREVGDAVGHGSIETTQIYRHFAATKKVPSLV